MAKRVAALLIGLLCLFLGMRLNEAQAAAPDPARSAVPDMGGFSVRAKGAVVIDAPTGRVLFAQDANRRLPMASTTKIMTALLTLEQDGLDDYFTVDSDAIHVEGSSMGLREGDSVSLSALAYGMLLPSGNDAANAAAARIAGGKQAFAALMNGRAAELGLMDTHFVTPSGLDDPEHYSSAYDLALLAREALRNPRFADICSRDKAVAKFGNPPYDRWLKNHNRLLRSYEGAVGVKTGFTDSAGRCLVSCAARGGVRLICVTLNCPDDWDTHAKLYDAFFAKLTPTAVGLPGSVKVPVAGGTRASVGAGYGAPPTLALLPGETLDCEIEAPPMVFAPVQEGQVLGTARVRCGDAVLLELPLAATEAVEARKPEPSLLGRLFGLG